MNSITAQIVSAYYCRRAYFAAPLYKQMHKYAMAAANRLLGCKYPNINAIKNCISIYESEKAFENELLNCIKNGLLEKTKNRLNITDKGINEFETYIANVKKEQNTMLMIISTSAGVIGTITSIIILILSLI